MNWLARASSDDFAAQSDLLPGVVRIGIDPGISGAVAIIDDDRVIDVFDMPVLPKASGKGNQVNAAELARQLRPYKLEFDPHVYVELVGAMPGQGVTSMFNFGKSAGIVEGVLAALGMSWTYVAPQSWKVRAGLKKREKDYARTRVCQCFPSASGFVARKRDSGRADAILIARFGEP